jgi:threonylcarbamoyladenosine tRNA methylthiotransferase MtaB
MRFAHAHIFPYSARTGTAAAQFAGQVPTAVKKQRLQRLAQAVTRTGQVERTQFVGTVRPVLWEGIGQPLTDQTGALWAGLTDNYLRVTGVAPAKIVLHNQITPVRLDALHGETLFSAAPVIPVP